MSNQLRNPELLLAKAEEIVSRLPVDLIARTLRRQQNISGVHKKRQHGEGENFWQYREYVANDAAPLIDWRKTAKSDKAYVREKELISHGIVWFWRDVSSSMNFASATNLYSKFDAANLLIASLALILSGNGEAVGLVGAGKSSGAGKGRMLEFCQQLTDIQNANTNFEVKNKGAKYIFVSDFYFAEEDISRWLDLVAASNGKAVMVKVNDPLESDFEIAGRCIFIDPESGERLEIGEPMDMATEYKKRFKKHESSIEKIAEDKSAEFYSYKTNNDIAGFLLRMIPQISEMMAA